MYGSRKTEEFCILFKIIKEHRHRWRQIFLLAKTELVKTYKGAVIGPFWAVVKPLFTLFIYWFAFTVGIRNGGNIQTAYGTFPRFDFMVPGFIAWFFISDSILGGSKAIRKNNQFVKKMSFPVSTIMTFTQLSFLFVHFMLLTLGYIYLVCAGYTPNVYNIQLLLYCPLMWLFFTALSWSTAPMAAFSSDFGNFINSVMTGLFWLSGIVWDVSTVSGRILTPIMKLNPINFFADGYRNALIYNRWFFEDREGCIIIAVELVVVMALGAFNYNRLRKTLPDVL